MIGWLAVDAAQSVVVARLVGVLQATPGRWRSTVLLRDGSRRATRTRPATLRRRLADTKRGMTGVLWPR